MIEKKAVVYVFSRYEIEKVFNRPYIDSYNKNSMSITDETVEKFPKSCVISILDSSGPFAVRLFEKDHPNVITLVFDDVTKDGEPSPTVHKNTIAFSEKQAKKLYNFIRLNSEADTFIVHCAAGISRSGAVGTFINDMYGKENFYEFKVRNPKVFPNQRILNFLNRLAYGR
jgi:predicted protein tyrosine phosphatase